MSPSGVQMAERLRDLRVRLDTVIHCEDTCCAKGLTAFRASAEQEPALREVLTSTEAAPVRGLAAVHLRRLRSRNIDIIRELDGCVGITTPAGAVPNDSEAQQVASSCPSDTTVNSNSLSWSQLKLSDICLQTAKSITGLELSPENYHAWRNRYPNPRDSLEMWQAMCSGLRPVPEKLLGELEQYSRELFVRVLLTHPDGLESLGVEVNRVASRLSGVATSADLLGILQNPSRWPELGNENRRDAFARNILINWRVLLGPEAGLQLETLWDKGYAVDRHWERYNLAWAVADAVPERRRSVLKAGLSITNVYPTEILRRLASEYPIEEEDLLVKWFSPPLAHFINQEAILDGVAQSHPPATRLFRLLSKRLSADDEPVLEHAVRAGTAVGCTPTSGTCDSLLVRFRKKRASAEDLERAKRTREQCLAALQLCSRRK